MQSSLSFVCQNCGAAYNRGRQVRILRRVEHAGRETPALDTMPVSIRSKRKGRLFVLETLTGKSVEAPRLPSGMASSIVSPAAVCARLVLLVGGDPGIGKSTLLTQATP